MLLGILGGVAAAFNSVDFLFRSRFLLCYKSPVRLLVVGSVTMMVMSLPFLFLLVPFASVPSIGKLILTTLGASCFLIRFGIYVLMCWGRIASSSLTSDCHSGQVRNRSVLS